MLPNISAFAPILTPFDAAGENIDFTAFSQHLNFLANAGIDGVLVLGTNGEFAHLSAAERIILVTLATRDERLKVIAGGTVPESVEGTLALCKQLNEWRSRLAGILVAPPYYGLYKSGQKVTDSAIADFYRHLAQIVTEVPLILYNVALSIEKQVTAAVSPAVVDLLHDAQIAGLKDSTGIVGNVTDYLSARPRLAILIGNDHAISAGVTAGARGSITACANVFPSAIKTLYRYIGTSQQTQAQAELSALRDVLEVLPGKLVAVQKLLLHILGVVKGISPTRVSGGSLTDLEKHKLLDQIGQICPTLILNQELGQALAQQVTDY